MAGTMSAKELRISCGTTLDAQVKTISDNSNAAAMTIIGNVMYMVKSHAKDNGTVVYKSMLLKLEQIESVNEDAVKKILELNYYVYGMAAKNGKLYFTCAKDAETNGILEMNTDGTDQKFTALDTLFVGIANYTGNELIIMKSSSLTGGSSLKCRRINITDLAASNAPEFTIAVNEAEEYTKTNGLHYDPIHGLFILTNHYVTNYRQCKNRILLVKPGDYENNCQYAPYAVFQADLDTKKYKQFNFEGIALYKGKMWGFANVSAVSGEPVQDSVIHHPGITFDDRTFCFKFNGSVTAGTPMKSVSVEDGDSSFQCKNVEAMAIDSKNTAYCLKCDKTSLRAALYKTETPEKGNVKDDLLKTAIATYNSNNCLHHCNGMTFNPEDGLLYVSGYPFSTSPATHVSEIIAMNTAGTISRRYRLDKAQYGISYYGKSDGNACFLLLQKARDASGTKLVFNKAVLSENKANVSEAFHVDYGFDPEEKDPVTNRHVDTMQDIFYHNAYGLFIPVCKRIDGDIVKAIIYHVSKEDVQKAMSSAEVETLHPDFGIVIDKSMKNPPELTDGDSYDAYEVESMDISRKLHKMILCANISYRVNNSYDAFYILNTLTFN